MTRHCHLHLQQLPWIKDIMEHVSPGIKPYIHGDGRGLNKRDMGTLPSSLDRPAIELGPDGMLRWLSRGASPNL